MAELDQRKPHENKYVKEFEGIKRVSFFEANHRGIVEITEECLGELLTQAGWTKE